MKTLTIPPTTLTELKENTYELLCLIRARKIICLRVNKEFAYSQFVSSSTSRRFLPQDGGASGHVRDSRVISVNAYQLYLSAIVIRTKVENKTQLNENKSILFKYVLMKFHEGDISYQFIILGFFLSFLFYLFSHSFTFFPSLSFYLSFFYNCFLSFCFLFCCFCFSFSFTCFAEISFFNGLVIVSYFFLFAFLGFVCFLPIFFLFHSVVSNCFTVLIFMLALNITNVTNINLSRIKNFLL